MRKTTPIYDNNHIFIHTCIYNQKKKKNGADNKSSLAKNISAFTVAVVV